MLLFIDTRQVSKSFTSHPTEQVLSLQLEERELRFFGVAIVALLKC